MAQKKERKIKLKLKVSLKRDDNAEREWLF